MKKKHIVLTLIGTICLILFIFMSVLGSFDFTRSKRLGKTDYYLVDGNPPGTPYWGLYHKDREEGIVSGRVTDIYWNEQYILATRQHIWNDSIIGYYIVKMLPPVKKGVPWEKIGPLSKEEYEQKKQELQLNEKEMKHKRF
jgi:hypothetical protein